MKVRDSEDSSRKNNICFDGLWQAQGEDWHGSQDRMKKMLRMLRLSMLIESVKKKDMALHRKEQL